MKLHIDSNIFVGRNNLFSFKKKWRKNRKSSWHFWPCVFGQWFQTFYLYGIVVCLCHLVLFLVNFINSSHVSLVLFSKSTTFSLKFSFGVQIYFLSGSLLHVYLTYKKHKRMLLSANYINHMCQIKFDTNFFLLKFTQWQESKLYKFVLLLSLIAFCSLYYLQLHFSFASSI